MIVSRNANLQELWNVRTQSKLTVMKGSVRFVENAKLCARVIKDFMTHMHVASGNISHATNGYLAVCMYHVLAVVMLLVVC